MRVLGLAEGGGVAMAAIPPLALVAQYVTVDRPVPPHCLKGDGNFDITEFAITIFQEIDIAESDITKKGK